MGIRLSDHFTYKKLLRFVLPSIAMMVFISVYGVVDGFFVSNFAGKTSFAAINLVMPFVMLLGGIGFMVGTGGTALVSKVLGEGNREKANRYFSMMVFLTLLLGVLLTAVGIAAMEPGGALFRRDRRDDCRQRALRPDRRRIHDGVHAAERVPVLPHRRGKAQAGPAGDQLRRG